MKRNRTLWLTALLAVLITACNNTQPEAPEVLTPVTITASYGSSPANTPSRIQYTEDGNTISATWQAGDQILVVYNGHVNTLSLIDGAGTASATFEGTIIGTPKAASMLICYVKDQNAPDGMVTVDADGDLIYSDAAFMAQDGTLAGAAKCNTYSGMTTYGDGTNLHVFFGVNTSMMKFNVQSYAQDAGKTATLSYMSGETEVCRATFTVTDGGNTIYLAIPPGHYDGMQRLDYACPANDVELVCFLSATQANFIPGQTYSKVVNFPLSTPLTFEAIEDGAVVMFDGNWFVNMQYSLNGNDWTEYYPGDRIDLTEGDKVFFWGNNDVFNALATGREGRFSGDGQCYLYGNIMSLLSSDTFATMTVLPNEHVFWKLFEDNITIYSHPSKKLLLPATTLTIGCYSEMFRDCINLTIAPELPATTLTMGCYSEMFRDCSNLTIAPELPATTLIDWCYDYMFNNCTNLSNVTCLTTNIPEYTCTNYWLDGVAESGTFTKASSMTGWTTGESGIPSGWTVVNFEP